jgi:oxygen-dependent protoporphyrinogen oxidase
MPESSPPRIAVLGGALAGLAAAYRLHRLLPAAEIVVWEASDRVGGALHTLRDGELVLERGADSFLAKDPVTVDLCGEIGLADELIPTSEQHRRALVVRRGRLEPVPDGFVLMRPQRLGGVLRSRVLSPLGKLRLACEPLVPRRPRGDDRDESIASFATRRLGREAYERLVEPLMGGIYVGDAEALSLAATMPEFLEAEQTYGSLWRSNRALAAEQLAAEQPASTGAASSSGARYNAFLTLRRGLSSLPESLAAALPAGSVRLCSAAQTLRRSDDRWQVEASSAGRPPSTEMFDAVVVATPAPVAGRLLQDVDAEASRLAASIPCASSVVASFLYEEAALTRPLESFGFVVPRIENREIVAASFPGVKFPGRCPPGLVPIRAFLGGALAPQTVDKSDAELVDVSHRELAALAVVRRPPLRSYVTRWRDAMPQYLIGHLARVEALEQRIALCPGLVLAGNAYRGVGIPHCLRSGLAAAEKLAAQLGRSAALGKGESMKRV